MEVIELVSPPEHGCWVYVDDEEYGPFRDTLKALRFSDRSDRGLPTRLYRDKDGYVYDSTEAWQ